MINGYDASIAYTDHHVKIILDELDRQGILDDAMIIISADHGDAFGEHGIYSDHVCADECINRIPFIIKLPDVSSEVHSSDSLLYNVDLAPTLCDLLDIPTVPDWDGVSFKENIQGGSGVDRDYLVWDHGLYTVQRAVRTKTHLMIRTYDDFGYPFKPVELYNMVEDPYQTTDISEGNDDIVQMCDHFLTEWVHEQRSKGHCVPDPVDEILRERSKGN